jgi:hypothetical protein
VWQDPPSPITAHGALVNDLDLTLTPVDDPDSYHTGNEDMFREGGGLLARRGGTVTTTLGAAGDSLAERVQRDTLNNVEQVKVPGERPGRWVVRVAGAHVPMGPQSYALVVTGPFGTDESAGQIAPGSACAAPCPGRCSGNGACVAGRCACDAGFSGSDCGTAAPVIRGEDAPVAGVVGSYQWRYYTYPVTSSDLAGADSARRVTIGVTLETLTPWTDADVFVSFDRAPTLLGHDYSNTSRAALQRVDISAEDVTARGPGVWHIGVFAYCCGSDAAFQIQAATFACPDACENCFRGTCAHSAASPRVVAPLVTAAVLLALVAVLL